MTALIRQFEAHAGLRPEAPCLSGPGGNLRYGELDAAADRIAGGLLARGIGPGQRIGLCFDWAPDLLAAMLGVWKTGAAYVPLDPALPAARLRAMVGVADPRLILVAPHWRSVFDPADAELLDPAGLAPADAGRAATVDIDGDAPAYLMFTSGTTGTPKAVVVSHASLADLFVPFREQFGLDANDAWTFSHSYGFGYSVWEIWGALTHGARLVPVPAALRADPVQLAELIVQQRVTVLSQTPAAFQQTVLRDSFSVQALQSLRLLALSGEAMAPAAVTRWFARAGGEKPVLINTYAVTETGGQVSCRVYESNALAGRDPASVGELLPGREIRILDEAGQAVAAGEVGELFVGGPAIAQGYFREPALTAAAFPRLRLNGETRTFYRTGDLARLDTDGSLVFAGRRDSQFKWRGYRIEAADVESALLAHPGIAEAAVALKGAGESARLAAFYAPAGEALAMQPEFWPSIGPYQVYDEFLYDLMTTESDRLTHFREAYARSAAGRVVLDLGTGEHALLARLCVEAGAAHVYAIELIPEAADKARALVEELGLSDRITVICGDVATVDLPQAVQLATQGIIGNIGSADGIVPIWNSARQCFADDCVPVPARCLSYAAPAQLPASLLASPGFSPLADDYARRVFEQVGGPFDIRLCVRNFPAEGLLAEPLPVEDLDFTGVLAPPAQVSGQFEARRAGQLDGFLLWTVVDAGEGEALDYFARQQAWLPVFLPLPEGGVPIAAGETIDFNWFREDSALCPDYRIEAGLRGKVHTCISQVRESAWRATALHRQIFDAGPRAELGPEALRRFLADQLPEYMIPSAWVELPALPLTANGKLDRGALPEPGRHRPALARPPVAPRDSLEEKLAAIWADALDLQAIGVEDNFFDLGGDSIAAVRLTSAIQTAMDAPLGLAALFDAPTVAGLAGLLREQGHDGTAGAAAMDEGVL